MSKIICDVCGTSYPETATQCPICGCVRPGDAHIVSGDTNEIEGGTTGGYTYVKGGRFSKANVKKRSRSTQVSPVTSVSELTGEKKSGKKADMGLIIAIAALLLAIIAVVIYIAVRFLAPVNTDSKPKETEQSQVQTQTQTESNTQETTLPQEIDIPCTNINVTVESITFDTLSDSRYLVVNLVPEDTTDIVTYASTNLNVATVDEAGKVVAVGPGEAIITITCGQQVGECLVICNFEVESTESTEPTNPSDSTESTTPDTSVSGEIKLNYTLHYPGDATLGDVTIRTGEKWVAYLDGEGKVDSSLIKFTSSNESIVTIDQFGVVKGVAAGEAYITAEYNGQKDKCRVLVIK